MDLANREARARLRNAALDAVLKNDTHERNKAMFDSYKYQGDLGRYSSGYLRDYGMPYGTGGYLSPAFFLGNEIARLFGFVKSNQNY